MVKPETKKLPKKKKKPSKKRNGSFFGWLFMGIFTVSIVIILVGFTGALVTYYTFADDLPDVRELKNFEPSTVT